MDQLVRNLRAIYYGDHKTVFNPTPFQTTLMLLDYPINIKEGDQLDGTAYAIKCNPTRIKDFSQTTEICLFAVLLDPFALQYVDHTVPYYDVICEQAVTRNGAALAYVENQTPELVKRALIQNTANIQHVKRQVFADCLFAIDHGESDYVKYIKAPDGISLTLSEYEHICIRAIEKSHRGRCIYAIKPENRTLPMILKAIDRDVLNVSILPKTHAACLALVKQNGNLIKYLDDDLITLEICIQAIKTSGTLVTTFVKNKELAQQAIELIN